MKHNMKDRKSRNKYIVDYCKTWFDKRDIMRESDFNKILSIAEMEYKKQF